VTRLLVKGATVTIDDFVDHVAREMSAELPAVIVPDALLADDLGLDSIHVLELILVIESLAGGDDPPGEYPTLVTLADAYGYYIRCLSDRVG
jgi:acyl carrier protein